MYSWSSYRRSWQFSSRTAMCSGTPSHVTGGSSCSCKGLLDNTHSRIDELDVLQPFGLTNPISWMIDSWSQIGGEGHTYKEPLYADVTYYLGQCISRHWEVNLATAGGLITTNASRQRGTKVTLWRKGSTKVTGWWKCSTKATRWRQCISGSRCTREETHVCCKWPREERWGHFLLRHLSVYHI